MPAARGVVAAGHPLTAEAGAQVLREGGNAVDAAICAVLTSFVTESQLTGFGAGGFMMVHEGGEDSLTRLLRRRRRGGRGGAQGRADPDPGLFRRDAPDLQLRRRLMRRARDTRPGWSTSTDASARCRWRGWPSLASSWAAKGVRLTEAAEYFHEILHPILISTPECAALYTPEGKRAGRGRHLPLSGDVATRSSASPPRAPSRSTAATSRERVCDWVRERGGTLGMDDMAAYEPIERAAGRRQLSRLRRAHQPAARPRAGS